MKKEKQKIHSKMDWNALDSCWAEQYEEDYGTLFSNLILNNQRVRISSSNIGSGILVSA